MNTEVITSKIVCPRCKGCGEVSPSKRGRRKKAPIIDDPSKKWCCKCELILPLDKFYKNTWYCKSCHNKKTTERNLKRKANRIAKYECKCAHCQKDFNGYSAKQIYCSRQCNCAAIRKRKFSDMVDKLPNELRDQFLEETCR